MQWVWQLLLLTSIGGYWLYKQKKVSNNRPQVSADNENSKAEVSTGGSESAGAKGPSGSGEETKAPVEEEVIRQLSQVEGVTSRVAKNLFDLGIYTTRALHKLSEEELLAVKGIGPKRKEKIMNSGTTK